jgi:hypothetical protein
MNRWNLVTDIVPYFGHISLRTKTVGTAGLIYETR